MIKKKSTTIANKKNTHSKTQGLPIKISEASLSKKKLNDLIRSVESKKVVSKKTGLVTLKLESIEYESVLTGLNKATRVDTLRREVDAFDEESDFYVNMICKARNAIPNKSAELKDYKKAMRILNAPTPKRGKRKTFNPEMVLEYHEKLINAYRDKNQTLSTKQKTTAVQAVKEKFGFASYEAARKYLTRKKAKNLPYNRINKPSPVR